MFTLAHLSDPHVPPLPPAGPGALFNKRFLGYMSWLRRRRKVHRAEVLERLVADLHTQRPDHIAVTGDLVNLALPAEFEAAARWLGAIGPAEQVTIVPGNHDAYVDVPWESSWRHWAPYMSDEAEGAAPRPPEGSDDFPFVRRRGPVALVGTNSAVPTGPGMATGRLGEAQLQRLEERLDRLGRDGCFRVLLIHHPLLDEVTLRRKRLLDSAALRAVLRRVGAELVLHGHDHIFSDGEVAGPQAAIPVFGIPSASALGTTSKPPAHYQLYRVERGPRHWQVAVEARGYQEASGTFHQAPERSLRIELPFVA
jgi:3',5'-cyclic AMP phosphodiesterase CpdA